ncbi:MAG: FAD:protein FMN transferase [Clostridia bacterium]|nr:FAD:protein FMN transferase [Clostridia bacterium]
MNKIIAVLISIITLLCVSGCKKNEKPEYVRHTESFIDYFDTVATVMGDETDSDTFNRIADDVEHMLKNYHELFDIYNSYEGKNNIYTINKNAGIAPVVVDEAIIDFIDYSKEMFDLTKGKTNITFGAVLKLWHDKRNYGINNPEEASLPNEDDLKTAKIKSGFDKIVIDRENSTVFITEKGVSLDVGAIAKGYATEKIAEELESRGISGYALNIGGNIRSIGPYKRSGDHWTAAVANPNGEGYILTLYLEKKSFVTSGSYQRFYTVDGKNYHHIIDPDTLFPANYFTSVSILTDNSAKADALSTALFCMSYEEGKALVENIPDTEAVWVNANGEIFYSSGFEKSVYRAEE